MRGRLAGVIVPVRYARGIAAALFVVAGVLPWMAAREGILRYDAAAATAGVTGPIRLRPDLVELPGGTFLMGSPETEKRRHDDETQHEVRVAPFAIFRTEVTLAQWQAVMGTRPNDCDDGCDDDHPVQKVLWFDALKYCNRLTDKENQLRRPDEPALSRCYDGLNWAWDRTCTGYRLPTEAEWEYAARAGTTTAYSFGDDPKVLCKYGNVNLFFYGEVCKDDYDMVAPVGKFLPNPWGLYDMHGNAREWVWDERDAHHDNPLTVDRDPFGLGDRRVLRGGSYMYDIDNLRSAARHWSFSTLTSMEVGFRAVRGVVSAR